MHAPLLFVGDLHLGRTPHQLVEATGLPGDQLGPTEALRRVVEAARAEEVQAVVLAGDVVDQDQDRFEAWSHLHDAVDQLVASGVRVLGVAGNHDHLALPRLAERIPDFTLLGKGGTWELAALEGLDLLGWSFPSRHHRQSPLESPGLTEALEQRRLGLACVGVLHGDLDAYPSPYAPVSRARLRDLGLGGWFLGHVHAPGRLSDAKPVGYLGSLVGLDRGELGPRGPWLVQPDGSGGLKTRQLALGPVYWTRAQVALDDLLPGDDAPDRILVAVEAALIQAASEDAWWRDGRFSAVGVRVELTGRSAATSDIQAWIDTTDAAQRRFTVGGVPCIVVRVDNHVRPPVDLEVLAAERSPIGRLARVLSDLEAGKDDAIPPSVAASMRAVNLQSWATDGTPDAPMDATRALREAAWGLLDQLLDQRSTPEVS